VSLWPSIITQSAFETQITEDEEKGKEKGFEIGIGFKVVVMGLPREQT
jgi:hypothetical protein